MSSEYKARLTISIHASRGGSDGRAGEALTSRQHFNPRFPRGKRHGHRDLIAAALEFQSTLPAGEATQGTSFLRRYLCISIHASRGGSDLFVQSVGSFLLRFQSTLPAGEATFYFRALVLYTLKFQSTLPAGEATQAMDGRKLPGLFQSTLPAGEATLFGAFTPCLVLISIHASRGGSDFFFLQLHSHIIQFQSTLPAGEATAVTC